MAVELATAYLSLVPSMSGTSGRIAKELGSSNVRRAADKSGEDIGDRVGKKSGSRVGRALKGAIVGAAAAFSVGAAFSFANDAVASFSELEDSSAAASVVFGKNMGSIIQLSDTAANKLGLSKQEVINASNTFGTYGKAAGLSGKELATFATENTKLAADMASFKGTSPEQAIEAIGAALRGETEPIRAYGVMLDDATLRNEALKMGLISTTKDALTPQQKTLAAQSAIWRQTTDAQGDFARTSQSTANIAKTLAANSANLKAQIGEKLAPAFTAARSKANELVGAISTFLGEMDRGEGLGGRFAAAMRQVGDAFQAAGSWIRDHQEAIKAVAAAYAGFVIGRIIGGLIASAIAWGRDTAATLANVAAKISAKTQTAALVAMYTGQWIAAQARSIGGWIRETAALVAHRVALGAMVVATKVAAVAQRGLNLVMRANPIGLLITAIGLVVGALVWFFTKTKVGQKIVAAAWSGIKSAISGVTKWWTGTAWPSIRKAVDAMGRAFAAVKTGIGRAWQGIQDAAGATWRWIDRNVFRPIRVGINLVRLAFHLARVGIGVIWAAMRSTLRDGWNWVNRHVFAPIKSGVRFVATAFNVEKNRILRFWGAVGDGVWSVFQWINKRVFGPIKRAIGLVGDAFRKTPGIVGKAWGRIKAAAARPINFVINTVYMKGIKGTWDKIAKAVGLDLSLPKISPIAFANGSEDHRAQIARGGAMRLWAEPETGGEAYIPLAGSKRGRSTAILSAVANKFGYGLQKYADGGIAGWFGDAWDKIKDVSSSFLSGPAELIKKAITGPMGSALASIGGGTLGKLVSALPKKLISGLIDKAKDFASSMFGGGKDLKGGGRFAGGPVMGWQNMWAVLKNAFPGATLNSAYRPGAITAVGTPSFHGQGRAIDVTPSMAIFNWLAKTFPNSSELIFSPAGGRQLYMGRQMMFGEPTRGDHWDHVHWAMANGGIFSGLFDNGGWLPNKGVGFNRSGRPEAVLDPDESIALKAGLGNGPMVGTMVVADPREAVQRLEQMNRRAAVRAGLAGRR